MIELSEYFTKHDLQNHPSQIQNMLYRKLYFLPKNTVNNLKVETNPWIRQNKPNISNRDLNYKKIHKLVVLMTDEYSIRSS